MSDLIDYLLSAKDRASPKGEELRHLGKRASAQYLTSGTSLNDAVAGIAKESSLNYEQVKRVAEAANNETFAQLFQKDYDKNVVFPLADHGTIVQKLQMTEAPLAKTASYQTPTKRQRYIPGGELVSLDYLLAGGRVKVAEYVPQYSTRDLNALVLRNRHFVKAAESDLTTLGSEFFLRLDKFRQLVKTAVAHGNPSWAVGAAIAAAEPSSQLYAYLQAEIGPQFMQRPSLLKMAQDGMVAMPDPQIMGLVQELEMIGQKMVAAEETMTRAKAVIGELLSILRGPDETNPAAAVFQGGQGMPPQGPPAMGMGPPPGMPPQ